MRDSDTSDTTYQKDILIPVKEGEPNEQLRYALRSLRNIPHGKVYIAGYKPNWVTNVEYIKSRSSFGSRFDKASYNILRGCQSDISQEFYLWSDDFYLVKPIEEIPTLYRGTLRELLNLYGTKKSVYLKNMTQTISLLENKQISILNYELHAPMIMDKDKFIETYSFMIRNHIPHGSTRSVYGNLHNIGGKNVDYDVKIYDKDTAIPDKFFSTSHKVWPEIQPLLDEMFPEPSKYEINN